MSENENALKPLPYVRDSSEVTTQPGQKEINWIVDGDPLYGNNAQSEPNFGTLNKTGTSLQENIEACDQNVHTVYDMINELSIEVTDQLDIFTSDLLQRTIPPKIKQDLPKYVILNEGDSFLPQDDANPQENVTPLQVENFDAIIWKKNGEIVQLPNVTESDIGAVVDGDGVVIPEMEGEYQAIAYNEAGSASSTKMFINVNRTLYVGLPIITEDLSAGSKTIREFEELELKVLAENYESIQWKRDGYPITGATTNVLNILNISASQAGIYSCDIVNTNGVTTSVLKSILVSRTINIPPTITVQPNNRSVNEEGDTIFIVAGQHYEYIHWEKDGEIISNLSSGVLQIFNATEADEGWYRAKLGNAAGVTFSQYVYLTVIPLSATLPPEMILQPPNVLNLLAGESLTIEVDSKYDTSRLWQKDGNALLNDSKVLTNESASLADTGIYRYLAFNANGYVESTSCIVMINNPEV